MTTVTMIAAMLATFPVVEAGPTVYDEIAGIRCVRELRDDLDSGKGGAPVPPCMDTPIAIKPGSGLAIPDTEWAIPATLLPGRVGPASPPVLPVLKPAPATSLPVLKPVSVIWNDPLPVVWTDPRDPLPSPVPAGPTILMLFGAFMLLLLSTWGRRR